MKFKNCGDCNVILTLENVADGDPEAGYCRECWDKGTAWTPMCEKCEEFLVQDQSNLYRIYCPKCEEEKFLVPIEDAEREK